MHSTEENPPNRLMQRVFAYFRESGQLPHEPTCSP